MLNKDVVRIAFATMDDFYVNYLYVTIFSAIINAHKNTYYEFYILVSGNFSQKTKKRLKYLERYKKCTIYFVDMKDEFNQAYKTHEHINYATYYRLLMPQVLPNVDKCIYLDSDIIVNDDLSSLYNTDIADYYIAGVRAAGYCSTSKENASRLQLPDCNNYINAGAILMNLAKMRTDNLCSQFIKLMSQKYRDQDQDILNVSCYGKIKIVPVKNNLMTPHCNQYEKFINMGIYTKQEVDDACKYPTIIHYADKTKPWNTPNMIYGNIWWKYAKKTPFYKKLKNSCQQCENVETTTKVLLFSFIPLLKVKKYLNRSEYYLFNLIPFMVKRG